MNAFKSLTAALLIAGATSASASAPSVDLPKLTFPPERDIISTQSCETDPETGVVICGSGS